MTQRLLQIAFALLSLAIPAVAQSPYQIQLTVPGIGGKVCGVISQETITDANGNNVPYDITAEAGGYSDYVCNNYWPDYPWGSPDPLFINLPPQPYIVPQSWVQILPPLAACADGVVNCLVRGPLPDPTLFGLGATVSTQDTFRYLYMYTFYVVKEIQYNGTNTRTWLWHKGYCGRGGCGKAYWVEQSAVVNMTADLLN